MEEFGFPPVFPADEEKEEEEKADEPVIKDKAKGKKVCNHQLLIQAFYHHRDLKFYRTFYAIRVASLGIEVSVSRTS